VVSYVIFQAEAASCDTFIGVQKDVFRRDNDRFIRGPDERVEKKWIAAYRLAAEFRVA
jgi:hypothetical protein